MRAELVVRISLAAAAVRLLAASGWRLAGSGYEAKQLLVRARFTRDRPSFVTIIFIHTL